jgi:hypothetical protein
MANFIITINNESHLAGITAAREAYNNSQSATITNEEGVEIPNPDLLSTDDEYVQFVMSKAAESYANQYNT